MLEYVGVFAVAFLLGRFSWRRTLAPAPVEDKTTRALLDTVIAERDRLLQDFDREPRWGPEPSPPRQVWENRVFRNHPARNLTHLLEALEPYQGQDLILEVSFTLYSGWKVRADMLREDTSKWKPQKFHGTPRQIVADLEALITSLPLFAERGGNLPSHGINAMGVGYRWHDYSSTVRFTVNLWVIEPDYQTLYIEVPVPRTIVVDPYGQEVTPDLLGAVLEVNSLQKHGGSVYPS
jgi:hypothetical protein